MIHRFGNFVLDESARELRAGDERLHVQPRVFDLLCFLAANPERAVSREEVLESVWHDVAVEDGSLTRAVHAARTLLRRDPAHRDAIETVYGFGYRFRPVPAGEEAAPDGIDVVVGRDAELQRIAIGLERVLAGERRLILIDGEPGIGKTSLVRAALGKAPRFWVADGQCLERFGTSEPYLPVLDALTRLARRDEAARRAVEAALRRAAPTWLQQIPFLQGEDDAVTATGIEPGELQRERMLREGIDALDLLSQAAPVALVLEDLHWTDPSTLDLVGAFAHRRLPGRVAVVCTARRAELQADPDLRAAWSELLARDLAEQIELERLGRDQVAAYLERAHGAAGSDALVTWLAERTGGNPLFLVQLVRHLREQGAVARDDGGQLVPVEDLTQRRLLPATLQQMIERQLGQLSPDARRVLQAASVAGHEFDCGALEEALGEGPGFVEEACDELAEREWLHFREVVQWPDGSRHTRFQFGHALYADAVYEGVPEARRARLHHAVAERLEAGHPGSPAVAGELAYHFERGGDPLRAAPQHAMAALAAARRHAADEAESHAAAGLDLLDDLPAEVRDGIEADLRIALAHALGSRDGYTLPKTLQSWERARELAARLGDVAREAEAMSGMALCLEMRGELARAREVADDLLAAAARADNPGMLRVAHDALAVVCYFQGHFAACLDHCEAAVRGLAPDDTQATPLRRVHDIQASVASYRSLALWHVGDADAALGEMERALARAELVRSPFTQAAAYGFAAILEHLLGDRAAQRAHADRCIAFAREAGSPVGVGVGGFLAGMAEPDPAARLPALREALATMATGGGLGGTFFLGLLAETELAAGNREEAANLLNVALTLVRTGGERNHEPALHLLAARLAEDDAAFAAAVDRAEEIAAELGSRALAERARDARDRGR